MPDSCPSSQHWRLDAVAGVWLLSVMTLALCLVTYAPLSGIRTPFGPAADDLSATLTDALGLGVVPTVFTGCTLAWLYLARRSLVRMGIRTAGWVLLVLVTSTTADYARESIPMPVSVFGSGGSVGAYLRFVADDHLKPPLPVLALSLVATVGLLLSADGLLRRLAWWTWSLVKILARGAIWFNEGMGRWGDQVQGRLVQWWNRPRPEVVPLVVLPTVTPVADPDPVPVTRSVDRDPHDTEVVLAPNVDSIPITHSAPPPPPLRVVPADDDEFDPLSPGAYEMPSLALLADSDPHPVEDHEQKLRERAALLEKTFLDFNLNVKVVGIHTGPVITQYEVALDTGLRLNKVTTLADDLALCLGVPAVRIVAPLPGRTTVGIEVPNDHRQTVRLKDLIQTTMARAVRAKLPIFLGKDVEGRPLVYDLAEMPHLLIAGRTGTGKSVCLNAIILSVLFTRRPDECRMIMIDPKKVELSEYGKVPHLMHPVVTDDKKAEAILAWAVDKMEERYELLRRARVRNIASYNDLGWDEILRRVDPQSEDERVNLPRSMPYIVIIVDEVGDLLMSMKKEVEGHIIRLAQKSRAAGIHLILATQKPTVDVITGLIKSNLPARICFQVASRADSAVVLDEKGADKLLGKGDMLFLQPGTSTIIRAQGAYVDDKEIERVVGALEVHEPNFESELLNLKTRGPDGTPGDFGERLRDRDPLYEQAIEIVIREQRGSTSLLQRAMGIGYGRASRLIDFMAEDGIVGGYNGSNAREVLVTSEEWESRKKGA